MPATDLCRFSLQLRTETYRYRTPIKFGGRVVRDVTVLSADCEGEIRGATATGLGSMTLGVAWAWPNPAIDDATKLELVLELSRRLAAAFEADDQTGHPLSLCHRQSQHRRSIAQQLAAEELARVPGLAEGIPDLAVLLAASPIEAALFDVHGKANRTSSYRLLSREHLPDDLSHFLDASYRGVYLDELIAAEPTPVMPLYHLVGALDPLTQQDVDEPVGDGLPETLVQWIARDGLSHLKIKLAGDDLDWDVDRVARVHHAAVSSQSRPSTQWSFSLDFNERCDSEEYVLEMLARLREREPGAVRSIRYVEQPTHRDLESNPSGTMHRVAEQVPVVIDESLVDLHSLRTAVAQGYSGIALKACKGHADALLLGAVARRENLYLCVQDLTCVGASLLHSASLAAHIPGVAALESNGRQYCPAGNQRWLDDYRGFFEIRDGVIPTGQLSGPGLGYSNDPASELR